MRTFEYYINLNERGCFAADVRNTKGKTKWEINIDEDSLENEMEGLPMRHPHDIDGLKLHLVSIGVLNNNDKLVMGQ